MGKASRKEARRQARLERQMQESRQQARQRRTRTMIVAAAVLVVAVAAAWGVWRGLRPEATASGPAQGGAAQTGAPAARPRTAAIADQGRAHIGPGAPHPAYNSNPPTSGWHYPTAARWGFYNDELPDELLVHNLEHGGIWISFKDSGDTDVVDALAALARSYRSKVIVTHRPKNDHRVAVAAWGHLMMLDRFDRDAIVDFIDRFKNKGPEFVPD